jgi:SprT protein
MDYNTLIDKVNSKAEELIKYSKQNWDIDLALVVNYNLKSIRALGSCLTRNGITTISLNKDLLIEFKELYINDVFIHEVAHAVVDNMYPDGYNDYTEERVRPHGKEFKTVCSHFGIDGKATTSLFKNSKSRKSNIKTFKYHCGCRDFNLTIIRHNKILKGASYKCKNCGKPLKLSPQNQTA